MSNRSLVIIRIIVGIALVLVLGTLGYFAYEYMKSDREYEDLKSKAQAEQTITVYTNEAQEGGTAAAGEREAIPVDFDYLTGVNPDCVGWIQACGDKIDYPIVKGTDDLYYLKHSFENKESASGCIFVQADTLDPFEQFVTYIYGHNMKDGSMFHELLEYKDRDYYSEHPTFTIYEPGGAYTCQIYAVLVMDNDKLPGNNNLDTGSAADASGDTEGSYSSKAYIDEVIEASIYDTGITPTESDSLIELITCEYSGENNRLVVCARVVK